jgi:hypothetical protein
MVTGFGAEAGALAAGADTGAEAGAEAGLGLTGAAAGGTGVGGGTMALKNGRERLPQPGILTSHPEEMRRRRSNIAEKMERLFKVSRNRASLGIRY